MRVLVTGSSGCLAAHLVESCQRKRDVEVWQTARKLPQGAHSISADLTHSAAVDAVVARVRPDLILHSAGSFAGNFKTDLAINAWSAKWLMDASSHTNCLHA